MGAQTASPGASTVAGSFAELAAAEPTAACVLSKRYGRWTEHDRGAVARDAAALARGLRGLGVGRGTAVLVLLEPSRWWLLADLALAALGARVATLPMHATPQQIARVRRAHDVDLAIVEKAEAADAVLGGGGDGTGIAHVLYVEKTGIAEEEGRTVALEAVRERGEALAGDEEPLAVLRNRLPADTVALVGNADPGDPDLAELGTTHGELLRAARGIVEVLGLGAQDRVLAARTLVDPVERGATVYPALLSGALLVMPESEATAAEAMWETAPTTVHLTTRQVKDIAAEIRVRMQAAKGVKGQLTKRWHRRFARDLAAGAVGPPSALWRLLLAGPVLEKLGLDRARQVLVSGDPVPREAVLFFRRLGLRLLPAYAVPSVGGLVAVATDGDGADVGRPLPGVEVRIDEDGEVLVSGERGGERWIGTGDLGRVSSGRLEVRHRKVEQLRLPSGEHVEVGALLRSLRASPYVRGAALTVHRGRVRLVVELMESTVARWAGRRRAVFTTFASLSALPEVRELVREVVAAGLGDHPDVVIDELVVLDRSLDAIPGAVGISGRTRPDVVVAAAADATADPMAPRGPLPEGNAPVR